MNDSQSASTLTLDDDPKTLEKRTWERTHGEQITAALTADLENPDIVVTAAQLEKIFQVGNTKATDISRAIAFRNVVFASLELLYLSYRPDPTHMVHGDVQTLKRVTLGLNRTAQMIEMLKGKGKNLLPDHISEGSLRVLVDAWIRKRLKETAGNEGMLYGWFGQMEARMIVGPAKAIFDAVNNDYYKKRNVNRKGDATKKGKKK